jgi:hypothetical protein
VLCGTCRAAWLIGSKAKKSRDNMGLKDMLFGKKEDAKKVEFRNEIQKAVADGNLTPEKIAALEKIRQQNELTQASQDLTMVRRDAYNKAADAIKAGGKLTEAEEAQLQKIQAYLGLKDTQIAQTKAELGRMRMLTEMKAGKFPIISETNTVLRGLRFNSGESPHWAEIAIMLEAPETGAAPGLKLVRGAGFQVGAANPYSLSMKGATPVAEGHLILTSERMIFKGGEKITAISVDKPEEIALFKDGVRLKSGNGKLVLFKFRSVENADFVGSIISRALNPNAAAGTTDDLDFLN